MATSTASSGSSQSSSGSLPVSHSIDTSTSSVSSTSSSVSSSFSESPPTPPSTPTSHTSPFSNPPPSRQLPTLPPSGGGPPPLSPTSIDTLINLCASTHLTQSEASSHPSKQPEATDNDESKDSISATPTNATKSKDQQYFSEIIPRLYLTSANQLTDANLSAYNVTHIVNATRTVPLKRNIRSIRVNILDSQYENIAQHFDTVGAFIEDALEGGGGGSVAVHCISGISRSSTLLIAYLMKHRHMRLKEAFNLVRSKRWFIRPNTGFFKQLVDYEHKLYGLNTVQMVWSDAAEGQVPDFILEDTSHYKFFYLCVKK